MDPDFLNWSEPEWRSRWNMLKQGPSHVRAPSRDSFRTPPLRK